MKNALMLSGLFAGLSSLPAMAQEALETIGKPTNGGLNFQPAATSLAAKVDAVLPIQTIAEADAWKFAVYPFADAARGFAHMPALRAAISARQKLDIQYQSIDGSITRRTVRPLHMEYWGRVWTLTVWCELRSDFRVFRVDLIQIKFGALEEHDMAWLDVEQLPTQFRTDRAARASDHHSTPRVGLGHIRDIQIHLVPPQKGIMGNRAGRFRKTFARNQIRI